MLAEELKNILNKNSEREISKFLKNYPFLIFWSFCNTGGHSKYVLHEFPLGSKHKADYVIPFSYSGVWKIHFIELKSPSDLVINKSGRPTLSFNSAIAQIQDWKYYIEKNQLQVREDLSNWCIRFDILNWDDRTFPITNYTNDALHDPSSYIQFHFHIIIGRRHNVSKDIRQKMNQYINSYDISVNTYDRFLDLAEAYDKRKPNSKDSQDLLL